MNPTSQIRTGLGWIPEQELLNHNRKKGFTVSPPFTSRLFHVRVDSNRLCDGLAVLECDGRMWRITWNPLEYANPLPILLRDLTDASIALVIGVNDWDGLLVRGIDPDHVFVVSFSSSKKDKNEILIRRLKVPSSIDIDYTLSTSNRSEAALRSYREFDSWVGAGSDCGNASAIKTRLLVAKVDPRHLWFLKFPLSVYARLGLGEFAKYRSVQWIATDRTFSENANNRESLANLLRSTPELLRGTVIVLNEYEKHIQSAAGIRVRATVSLLRDLLVQFENILFGNTYYSLRWAFNPSENTLKHLLCDPSTRIFYAAFEAESGHWELPESENGSSLREQGGPKVIELGGLRGKLQHIQLLRIFHCNSVFDPFVAASQGGAPADRGTIARQLLETDAQFVEGGMTQESYFEFACSVIQLLFQGGLRLILESRALEGKLELDLLVERCNKVLEDQGFDRISQ